MVTTPIPNGDQDDRALYLAAQPFTRAEVFDGPCLVPASAGVYGWWFRELPSDINTAGCETRDGLTLLYAGISPSAPPANGKPASRQHIRRRIRTHYSGNAEVSALRKTLGCLLADQLGIELRRVGTGKRRTFVAGEKALSEWMAKNALVSWIVHPEPWVLEHQLIETLDVPLNLQGNAHNNFYPTLKAVRRAAAARANVLPVLPNPVRGPQA